MYLKKFQTLQFVLIQSVIKQKSDLHVKYQRLLDKLVVSKKSDSYKLTLGKRILGRLIRESNRIFISAQKYSTKYCPSHKKSFESKSILDEQKPLIH